VIRCLAIDVLLLREFACAGTCLPSRCLAMGIHVTTFSRLEDFGLLSLLRSNSHVHFMAKLGRIKL
jgi:hypothetical protein